MSRILSLEELPFNIHLVQYIRSFTPDRHLIVILSYKDDIDTINKIIPFDYVMDNNINILHPVNFNAANLGTFYIKQHLGLYQREPICGTLIVLALPKSISDKDIEQLGKELNINIVYNRE